MKMCLKDKGFTLIELIVVIAILAIMSALAVPRIASLAESAKLSADKASLRILNNTTTIYRIAEGVESDDVFEGLGSDDQRIALLVDNNYLSATPLPQQEDAGFMWNVDGQIWRLNVSDTVVPLSPLGSDFTEISSGFIDLITSKGQEGGYGRTWGDYKFTDIGLDPDDWQDPVNHMLYKPSGQKLMVTPEDGYEFKVELESGESKTVWKGYNIIYDVEDKNWYYHFISLDNIIDIDTLRVETK